MNIDLQQSLLSFSLLGASWVLWLLVALGVLILTVTLERLVYMWRNTTPSNVLETALSAFLKTGDAQAFQAGLDSHRGMEARVLAAGLEAAAQGTEAAEEALTGHLLFERMRMERGLIALGTVGANTPFIGLFGTVLGIIKAFHELAEHQAEAASAVMSGISEALVATAIGLMVAIPAVILFNWLNRRVKNKFSQIEALSHLVLARLKSTKLPSALPAQPAGAALAESA
jgi:biopolymer transport protein ExbB